MNKNKIWLRDILTPLWPAYRQALFISLFTNILALATPIYILQIYDRVVFHYGLSTLKGLTIGMVIVLFFDLIMRLGRARLLQGCGARIEVDLSKSLFDKISNLPLKVIEGRPASYWQSLFSDAQAVRMTWSGPTALALIDVPFLFLALFLIMVIAAPVVWVMAISIPAFLILAIVSGTDVQNSGKKSKELTVNRNAAVGEFAVARNVIKAQALQETVSLQWMERQLELQQHTLHRTRRIDRYRDLGQTFVVGTTIFMTVVGALAILEQQMTIGSLIAANMLSGRVLGPLNNLVAQWRGISEYREARDRLSELFSAETDLVDSPIKLPRPKGSLLGENISFRYSEDDPEVLSGVQIQFGPKGLYTLVGPNGSGKTTLLKILRGLYAPTHGRVTLDGSDVKQISQKDLSNFIGYLPQSVRLFAGTIRENIALKFPDATDGDILQAANYAGAHRFITDIPVGYGANLGEAGQRLSGGQQKLIALAGVFLKEPPVLLLDEPASDLDADAAEALRRSLRKYAEERTVVIATHDRALIRMSDGVAVLDKGKLVLGGKPDQVLSKLGFAPEPVPITS